MTKIYKTALAATTLALALVQAASAGTVTASNTTPGAIPDGNGSGINRSIEIGTYGTFTDLIISVSATHTWIGDLIYTLSHNGKTVKLLNRPGLGTTEFPVGENSDFSSNFPLTFKDSASISASLVGGGCDGNGIVGSTAGCANATFKPFQSLSAFNGQDLFGTWTLNVSDNDRIATGTLTSWSLTATTANQVPEPASLALVGLALAGVCAARRRRA